MRGAPGVGHVAGVVPKDGVHHGGHKVPRNDLGLRLLVRALLHERLRTTAETWTTYMWSRTCSDCLLTLWYVGMRPQGQPVVSRKR